jgi:hypothetical protein
LNTLLAIDAELFRLDSVVRWLDAAEAHVNRVAGDETTGQASTRNETSDRYGSAAARAPAAGVLGTALDAASVAGPPVQVNAQVKELERRWGRVDVIENESVRIPGTLDTFELRAQDYRGPFGGPLLSLVSGQYPTTASQIAVTSGVAGDYHLRTGGSWTVNGVTRTVTGIVQNPESLLDEFALVIPGQVTNPDNVTVRKLRR